VYPEGLHKVTEKNETTKYNKYFNLGLIVQSPPLAKDDKKKTKQVVLRLGFLHSASNNSLLQHPNNFFAIFRSMVNNFIFR
jgi:hypothetical protein